MPPRTQPNIYFVAFVISYMPIWSKCVRIAWTACVPWILCHPVLSRPSGVPGCFWIHRGRGISKARVSRELAPQPPKTEKSPLPSQKFVKNKKGDFQFYKSSLRSLHKYIFNPLLTYRYVYGIFKAHRRCYPCKSIKQLGK